MNETEQQSLYVAILGMERPGEVTEMLAGFAADKDFPLKRYREVSTVLIDGAQRQVGETMTIMRALCAPFVDLIAKLDEIEAIDMAAAEVTHTAAKHSQAIVRGQS